MEDEVEGSLRSAQSSEYGRMGRACLLALAALAAMLGGCGRFEPGRRAASGPEARAGTLDLRSWDFRSGGPVSLWGEWLFLPGALAGGAAADSLPGWVVRRVPDVWKGDEAGGTGGRGAGTYRLVVLLPPGCPPLAVRNGTGMSAFELESGGEIVARAGRPALLPGDAASAYRPGVAPVEPRDGRLDLVLRTSNFEYRAGGVWRPLVLGDRGLLAAARERSIRAAISVSSAIASAAAFSLIVYLFRRRERSFLFFCLFGLALVLRPLLTGEYWLVQAFPAMPFGLVVRLEYASAVSCLPAAMALFASLFPGAITRRTRALLVAPLFPCAFGLVFLPLYWLTWGIFAFYALAFAEMLVACALILGRALRVRAQGAATCIGAIAMAVLAGANDLLNSSRLIRTAPLIDLALLGFVFAMTVVLAQRYARAFGAAEELSAQLAGYNEALTVEVAASASSRARLEASLAEKEVLLKEVHHRVKNSLQIVSSIVALQSHRSDDPAMAELSGGIRDRIRAISLAHEQLYNLDSGDLLDIGAYARELLRLNAAGLGTGAAPFEAAVEASSILLDAGTCIDCGLILTELLSNAIKHSAGHDRGGAGIRVRLEKAGGALRLAVEDDGPGFPPGFDPAQAKSLGFRVVCSLAQKRGGRVEILPGPGGRVVCELPLPEPPPV